MAWTFRSDSYEGRYIELSVSQEQVIPSKNLSKIKWTLSSIGGSSTYYDIGETTVRINGLYVYHKNLTTYDTHEFPAKTGSVSGETYIEHDADGKKDITIYFATRVYIHSPIAYANNAKITLSSIPTYSLSISAGNGSSIVVKRTSGYGSVGTLSNESRLYYGDRLQISFNPENNYTIVTHTVNDVPFISGGTYTTTGDVYIVSTAQELSSSVGATSANIESVSTITITKYNPLYCHSLQYNFGSLSGYITNSGAVSDSEVKFTDTSVAFTIPADFYAEIPDKPFDTCVITCRTYDSLDSTIILGSETTCNITVTATGVPSVSGTVTDINPDTVALTGDSSVLVRYKSTAEAKIVATGNNQASIALEYINDEEVVESKRVYNDVELKTFAFKAVDSRGYSSITTITPTIVEYIQLSINPKVERPSPTSNSFMLSFTGDMYMGAFDADGLSVNTLSIRYRYKEVGGTYSDWVYLSNANIVFDTKSFRSNGTILLPETFSYNKGYLFEIEASDGSSDVKLSTVTKLQSVPKGIPVFDWGENDFNFHVPIKIGNTQLTEEQLQKLLALLT